MAKNWNNGRIVADKVVRATGAAGQSIAAGGIPDIASNIPKNVKDIGQKVFSGIEGASGNFMSALRGKNLPGQITSGPTATASFSSANVEEKDWRVSLSLPAGVVAYNESELLEPLKSTGNRMVFPFTPTIIIQHSANYNSSAPIHNNYPFFSYQNSQVNELVITGQFFVQNSLEAKYWTSCLHYLRSVTKMDFGEGSNPGAPPPIVKLNGYGDYVFNNVPVIITTFTVDMPNEVDYIATGINSETGNPADSRNISWAPAESQFSVSVQPIYSRSKQTVFNYDNFIKGNDIGQGYI